MAAERAGAAAQTAAKLKVSLRRASMAVCKQGNGNGWISGLHALLTTLVLLPAAATAGTAPNRGCDPGPWLDCGLLQLQSSWPSASTNGGSLLSAQVGSSRPLLEERGLHGLRLRFDARSDAEDLLRRWRYGVGFDLELPGNGLLQTSFQTSRRRIDRGVRYALTPDGFSTAARSRLWALGLAVAPGEDGDGSRRLVLAPQFRLDLDRCLPLAGRAELSAEFAPWAQDFGDNRRRPAYADERMPQVQLRWRF